MNPWMRISMNMGLLGVESASVIALRSLKLAGGGAGAAAEAHRMVAEKIDAAMAAQAELARGAFSGAPHLGAERAPVERLGGEMSAWFPGADCFSLWEEDR